MFKLKSTLYENRRVELNRVKIYIYSSVTVLNNIASKRLKLNHSGVSTLIDKQTGKCFLI